LVTEDSKHCRQEEGGVFMKDRERIISEVAASLEREPCVNLHRYPVHLEFDNGVLTLEGEVDQINAKKKALKAAAAVPGVGGIVDRLRVAPAERMQDGEILDHVCKALMAENLLNSCAVRAIVKKRPEVIRETEQWIDGRIDVEVSDGVVVLNGAVTSFS